LLVTVSEESAAKADCDELAHRLWTVNIGEFRKNSDNENRQKMGKKHIMLEEAGLEKARERLSSISRFAQDLKQSFARYYNKKHQRLGCLWGSRFKGVIVSHGNAQLACSSYIDLNPVRAGLVQRPEDYRWCALGLMKQNHKTAKYLLTPVQITAEQQEPWEWYKSFVHESGKIEQVKSRGAVQERSWCSVSTAGLTIAEKIDKTHEISLASASVEQTAKEKCRELKLDGKLISRIRNLSEGIVVGTARMIACLQDKLQRQPRVPKEIWEGSPFFTTRVFHRPLEEAVFEKS
jgi:hypothetical protein